MGDFGFGAAEGELDLDSFKVAADACDEQVTIPVRATNTTGAPIYNYHDQYRGIFLEEPIEDGDFLPDQRPWQVGINQAKYTTDAILDPKSGVVQNVKLLLEGMGWALPWSNGKHKLIVEGVVAGPVMSFDEDTILDGWTIEYGRRADRLNRVTVEFPNVNKDYEQDTVSWPKLDSPVHQALVAEDNGQALHTNKSVKTITDFYAAQAYAEYLVRKSRVGMKITGLKLASKAMLLEPGDVIELTYLPKNLSNTLFIVERVSVSAQLDVSANLLLYDPTVYGAPELEDEPIAGSPYNPNLWQEATVIDGLTLEAVHESNADGSVISSLRISWNEPPILDDVVAYEVRWKKTADADFEHSKFLTAATNATQIKGLVNNTDYTVEVTYKTRRGRTSDPAQKTIFLDTVPSAIDVLTSTSVQVIRQVSAPDPIGLNEGSFWYDTVGGQLFVLNAGDWVETVILNTTHYETSAPAGAVVGDFWYDTDSFVLYQLSEAGWQQISTNDNIQVFRTATAPATTGLSDGSFWYNISNGVLSILSENNWQDTATRNQTFYQATAPAGTIGDLWYDTDDEELFRFDGSQWQSVGSKVNIRVFSQASAPDTVGLADGSFWFNTATSVLFALKGGNWTETATSNNTYYSVSEPSGSVGDLWYNPTSGVLSRHNGTGWEQIGTSNNISIFRQANEPSTTGLDNGSLWTDTDTLWLYVLRTGVWERATPADLAELDSAASDKLDGIEDGATVGATAQNLELGIGVNQLVNADLRPRYWPWLVSEVKSAMDTKIGIARADYYPEYQIDGTNVVVVHETGNIHYLDGNGNDVIAFAHVRYGLSVPVIGGQRYEFRARANWANCGGNIQLWWYAEAGTATAVTLQTVADTSTTGGNSLAEFTEVGGFINMPATAVRCWLQFRKNGTQDEDPDSHLAFTRPYFGLAHNGQTDASVWSPGGGAGVESALQLLAEQVGGSFVIDPASVLTATADSILAATINVSPFSIYTGQETISYAAATDVIASAAPNTTYHVYVVDPDLNGGTVTYEAETDRTQIPADSVYLGLIRTPAWGASASQGTTTGNNTVDPNFDYETWENWNRDGIIYE